MKALAISLILAIGVAYNVTARTAQEIIQDVNNAASAVVATYKSSGMGGLEAASQSCWRELERQDFTCIYIDMSARYVDRLGGGGDAFPLNVYFDDDQFGLRAASLFNRKRIGMEDANKYMAMMQPMVNGAVDHALKISMDSPESCVNRRFSAWERKRDVEIKKWCRELDGKGEECRISAGVDEDIRAEALRKFQAECLK